MGSIKDTRRDRRNDNTQHTGMIVETRRTSAQHTLDFRLQTRENRDESLLSPRSDGSFYVYLFSSRRKVSKFCGTVLTYLHTLEEVQVTPRIVPPPLSLFFWYQWSTSVTGVRGESTGSISTLVPLQWPLPEVSSVTGRPLSFRFSEWNVFFYLILQTKWTKWNVSW